MIIVTRARGRVPGFYFKGKERGDFGVNFIPEKEHDDLREPSQQFTIDRPLAIKN